MQLHLVADVLLSCHLLGLLIRCPYSCSDIPADLLPFLLQQAAVRHDDSHEGAPCWQDWQCQQQRLHAEEAVQDVRHSRQRICEYSVLLQFAGHIC